MTSEELFLQEQLKVQNHPFTQELLNCESQITAKRYATYLFNLHPQLNVLEQLSIINDVNEIRVAPSIWYDYKELWATTDTPTESPVKLPIVDEYVSSLMKLRNDRRSLRSHVYVRHMLDLNLAEIYCVPGEKRLFTYPNDTIEAIKSRYENHEVSLYNVEMQKAFDIIIKQLDQMAEL
jgi:hypothetical protein